MAFSILNIATEGGVGEGREEKKTAAKNVFTTGLIPSVLNTFPDLWWERRLQQGFDVLLLNCPGEHPGRHTHLKQPAP